LVLRVDSEPSGFPGQTGGNNNNFHYEDCISKISHIVVGLLKELVSSEN
jgi:D-sedoheptulose 7-phosphate isomerase